jgi:hypothetical protein
VEYTVFFVLFVLTFLCVCPDERRPAPVLRPPPRPAVRHGGCAYHEHRSWAHHDRSLYVLAYCWSNALGNVHAYLHVCDETLDYKWVFTLHTNPTVYSILDDKFFTHQLLNKAGVPQPKSMMFWKTVPDFKSGQCWIVPKRHPLLIVVNVGLSLNCTRF